MWMWELARGREPERAEWMNGKSRPEEKAFWGQAVERESYSQTENLED